MPRNDHCGLHGIPGVQRTSVLAGYWRAPPSVTVPRTSPFALIRDVGLSLLKPAATSARFGLQRAIAIGLGVVVVSYLHGNENVFWIVLSMIIVMQPDASASARKGVQAAIRTVGGVVLALAPSLILPPAVLYPWLAAGLMIGGFAWMKRNYASMTVGTASAVVLLIGVPADDVGMWAGLRLVDVAAGAVIATIVTRFVLPIRPDPAKRIAALVTSLHEAIARLRARLNDEEPEPRKMLNTAFDVGTSVLTDLNNLRADISNPRLADPGRFQPSLEALEKSTGTVLALGGVILNLPEPVAKHTLHQALDRVEAELDSV